MNEEMISLDDLHAYWKYPSDNANATKEFVKHNVMPRSIFLYNIINRYADKTDGILEIGCNAGRNLNYLYSKGFKNLAGIEISKLAVDNLRKVHPDLNNIPIYNCPVENRIKNIKDNAYDIVFTMAVLQHIHPDSEWIFPEIKRITKKYLITIEKEETAYWRRFPRNYKSIFEKIGMREVENINAKESDMLRLYIARILQK